MILRRIRLKLNHSLVKIQSALSKGKVTKQKIAKFQKELSKLPNAFFGDTENCPLKHSFADGVYVREIFIPKGMCVVGKIHKFSHPNFLLKGKITVATEGEGVEHLEAPQSIISPAGTKRVVYAHEDTVWVTVHVTKETDLSKIEDEIIAKNYKEVRKCLS